MKHILPKVADSALLRSMAMRNDHSFGLKDEQTQNHMMSNMSQLYEECSGEGFYKHPESTRAFTIEEIADYISGWAMGPFDSVKKIGVYVLHNALSQLECEQDGIVAVVERKSQRQ